MRSSRTFQAAACLLSLCLIPETILGQNYIRLEDIVAGGDGSGTAPPANTGIDPRSGAFTTGHVDGRLFDADGVNPQPVPASPYIDSVFILAGGEPFCPGGNCLPYHRQRITQSGIKGIFFDGHAIGSGWNYILKNRSGGVSTSGIGVGPYSAGDGALFTTAIGIHSSMGITFDLDELRRRHGDAAVGCFSTFWGMDGCSTGQVELIAILTNDAGLFQSRERSFTAGQGEGLSFEIPRAARYLTLVTGSGGADACDHGTFARPVITPVPCPGFSDGWIWSVTPSRVSPQGEFVSVEGEGLFDGYSIRVGGVDLLQQTYLNDQLRRGISPSLAPGVYDVEVAFDGEPFHRLPRAMEVAFPPTLVSVTPSTVLLDRATPVTIRGTNLRSDMTIYVRDIQNDSNDLPLIDPRFIAEDVLTGSLPPVPAGQGSGPRSLLLLDQGRRREDWGIVTYVDRAIERVEPSTVSTEGGTEVTFVGLNLSTTPTFRLGGQPLTNVAVLDSSRVRGTSPPLPQGSHAAELVAAGGSVLFTLAGAVTAVAPAPLAIASISPHRVYTLGGTLVTITTTAAHRGAAPRVNGSLLVNSEVVDGITLRGEVPPLAPGFYDVELVDGEGTVVATAANGLEALLDSGIAITTVSPTIVSTVGGTELTFTGTGFSEGFVPRVGGIPLDGVVLEGSTRLRGITRPLDAGIHKAAIHGGDQRLAVWAGSLTAVAPSVPADMYIGQVRPARVAAGGSIVRFVGTNFPGDLVPRLGGVALEDFRAVSLCRYEGRAPVLPPGRYVADLFRPGFGVVAELTDLVEVAAPGAAPKPSHIVSARVLADGSTRLYVFGHDFAPETVISVGGKPLVSPTFVSDELIVGNAPPLGAGEALGLRVIVASDGRGSGMLENGVRYQKPEITTDTSFVRGDPNQDGKVNISDPVYVLGFLFLGNPISVACLDAADADTNGSINLTDAIYLLQFLFLGGREPASPFPTCGLPAAPLLGCGAFSRCGGGGGGIAANPMALHANVKPLAEAPENPLDPIVVEIAPEGLEIVIRDPPGGRDVASGDVIVGPTPLRSDAVHNGVAYMLKLEEPVAGSCLVAGDGGGAGLVQDKVFRIRPARFDEVISQGALRFKQDDFAGAKVSYRKSLGSSFCNILADGAGGGAADSAQGQGGACISDCIALRVNEPKELFNYDDGNVVLKAGFSQCEVNYVAGTEMEIDFRPPLDLEYFKIFSGARLDSTINFYVEARAHGSFKKEEKVGPSYRKDELIIFSVAGLVVVILVTVEAELVAGVEVEADVNMRFDAGATGRFNTSLGIELRDGRVRNISALEEPTLEKLPGTPGFSLDGSASVKGYVRPEASVFGGLYIAFLTGKIKLAPEVFARIEVGGSTNPPCFEYGFFAGGKLEVHPEIQFLGKDVWDPPAPFKLEQEFELVGGKIGCKRKPVAVLKRTDEVQGSRLILHLDATGSHDPDSPEVPLNYRWDFNSDGVCDRNTGSNPRTTYVYDPATNSVCRTFDCSHQITLRVTDDEQTYAEETTGFRTTGSAGTLRRANVLAP